MKIDKFDFSEINLIPQKCIVNSRSECDTSVKFGKFEFKLPIVPANMECVVDENACINLAKDGYFYIMHRFNFDSFNFVKKMKSLGLISSISIGVNDDSYELVQKMVNENVIPDFITIDIAHGHSVKMEKMIKFIKKNLDTFVIAGNISTGKGAKDLEKWGADALKVGIGPGSACFIDGTKINTKKGYINIEDVSIGDFVLTHTGKYEEVINTIKYETTDNLISINNEICTEDHKFFIVDIENANVVNDDNYLEYGRWVSSKDLDENKNLIITINEFDRF